MTPPCPDDTQPQVALTSAHPGAWFESELLASEPIDIDLLRPDLDEDEPTP